MFIFFVDRIEMFYLIVLIWFDFEFSVKFKGIFRD